MVPILVVIQSYCRVFTTLIQLYLTLLGELVNIYSCHIVNMFTKKKLYILVINDSASQQYLPEQHMSVERPLNCQPVGHANDICQTAYNLGAAENHHHQHALTKNYTDQSIR